MVIIKDNIISLTRGDSCTLDLNIVYDNGNQYTVAEDDKILFTLKKNMEMSEEFSVTANSKNQIVIEPSHTELLAFGSYLYDVQLNTAHGKVYTIIAPTRFNVTGEVHL